MIRILTGCVLWMALGMVHSCKKEEIGPFDLVSILASGEDIRTSPVNIPVNAVINATFSTDIDPSSIKANTVVLTRDYDSARMTLTLIVSRNVLTISYNTGYTTGTDYTVTIDSLLKSKQGVQFRSFTGKFKTVGGFVPANQLAYWSFENSPEDIIGSYDPAPTADIAISYVPGRSAAAGMAASFDGKTSIIEIAGGTSLLTPQFTISLWMYLNSDNHQDTGGNQKGNFVFGIGNGHGIEMDIPAGYEWCRISHALALTDGTTATSDFQYFANGRTRNDLTNEPDSIKKGIENSTIVNQDLGPGGIKTKFDKVWTHVAFTFDGSTQIRSMYINGELMYQQNLYFMNSFKVYEQMRPLGLAKALTFIPDFNIPPRYADNLVFGFWQNKIASYGGTSSVYSNVDADHFHGLLDDVRIFTRALTDQEVSLIFQQERP